MRQDLRASVVIDYQNVHLTAAGLYMRGQPAHEALIHPGRFASRLAQVRNDRMSEAFEPAQVTRVLVFRGLPSATHDPDRNARNLQQQGEWQKDPRVRVSHRPLRYSLRQTPNGRVPNGPPQEKGIDVLCALAVLAEARQSGVDVVVLASQDTDLAPAIEAAAREGAAKVETCSWADPERGLHSNALRTNPRVWNTTLSFPDFQRCRDLRDYT